MSFWERSGGYWRTLAKSPPLGLSGHTPCQRSYKIDYGDLTTHAQQSSSTGALQKPEQRGPMRIVRRFIGSSDILAMACLYVLVHLSRGRKIFQADRRWNFQSHSRCSRPVTFRKLQNASSGEQYESCPGRASDIEGNGLAYPVKQNTHLWQVL